MADPLTEQIVSAIILFAAAIGVVAFLEIRFLRKRMKGRRMRFAKRDDELSDQAHNAVVTTRAIVSSMERQGVKSDEASAWMHEAELALGRRNFRVALDLTSKTRDRLMSLKAAETSRGDLAKLDQMATVGGSAEVTTKERLQKEFPPNLLQSKFSIDLAETAIDAARSAGKDTAVATQLLGSAKARYDAQDYDGALRLSRQSKRSAGGESVEVPALSTAEGRAVAVPNRACPSCGVSIRADDAFCRKCGTRVSPSACASCGTELLPDDAFCRKCGTPLSR